MLLAEDLILLTFCDETGADTGRLSNLDYRLAGALLMDLVLAHRIELSDGTAIDDDGRAVKKGRLVVRGLGSAGHPELDDALAKIGQKPRKASSLIDPLSKGLRGRLLEGLTDRGILRRERNKWLGLFPYTRWPAEDSTHEEVLVAHLRAVLTDGVEPDARERAIIALSKDTTLVKHLVDKPQRRAAEARAKEIRKGEWVGEAVAAVISEMEVAVMIAISAAVMASCTAATSAAASC